MEQHAIPQNISSYQFHLVGDMTLKQFFQLAGGLLVSLIIYSSPIIGIIKWPFVIVSAILGATLAFVPLEERPLETWIFAFFKVIYTPTEFFWKKTTVPTKFFQDEAVGSALTSATSKQEAALKSYLSSTKQNAGPLAKLEETEQGFLAGLSGIFAGLVGQGTSAQKPAPATAGRTREIQFPVTVPVKITPQTAPRLVVEERPRENTPSAQVTSRQVAPIIAGEEMVSTKQAVFSVDAAPPNPPTIPNVVVGQVVDQDRKIVEGAIMEIRDEMGRPVRALRSNRVGHFITVTPLDSGRYDIATEKDGYQFAPATFEAVGNLIPPILVEGKKITIPETVPIQQPTNRFSQQPTAQF